MKPKNIKQSAVKTLSFFQKNKKPLLIGTGVILGGVLMYRIFNGISHFVRPKAQDYIKGTGQGVVKNNLTITQFEAQNLAQQLLDAMNLNDCWVCYGTDEQAILSVFRKIQNKDDFLLVYNAFGRKDYNGFNSPPTGITRHLDTYEPRDLVYWLKSELSEADQEVFHLVKKTIQNAGFVF